MEEKEKLEHADVPPCIFLVVWAADRTVHFPFALVQIQNPQEASQHSSPSLSLVAYPVDPGHFTIGLLEAQTGQEGDQ